MLTPDFGDAPTTEPSHQVADPITELLRGHARELIALAVETEVQSVMRQLRAQGVDVVRNGYLPERTITTAVGDVVATTVGTRFRAVSERGASTVT